MPRNTASTRVLEKAGYLREGLMKQNMLVNGTWEDHWHFAQVNPVD